MKLIFCFVFVSTVLISAIGVCQVPGIDRAKQKIYDAKSSEETLARIIDFCKLRNSLHGDTIYRYALWAKQLALQLNDKRNLAWSEYAIISSDLAKGKIDSIVPEIDNNRVFLNIRKLDPLLYYKVQLLKANVLNRMNDRPAALELQLKLLLEAEKDGNMNAQLFLLNFIGATYLNISGKSEEGKQALLKGLQMISDKPDSSNDEIEAYLLSNLALYYFNNYYVKRTKGPRDSFFITVNRCIEISKAHENLGVLASALLLRGNFQSVLQQFSQAVQDFQQGLATRKLIGDPYYIIDDLTALANFYLEQKEYDKSIATAAEGIAIAEKIKINGLQMTLLGIMAGAYKAKGDFVNYSKLLERIGTIADSNYRLNSAEEIANIQAKYEVQKKETLIAQQKLDILKRNIFLYGGGIIVLLLLSFLAIRFRQYKRTQAVKLTAILEEERRRNQLLVKEAEENERVRIAADLHDNLGVYAASIASNLSYIQMPEEDTNAMTAFSELKNNSQAIISQLNDTIWVMKKESLSLTTISDRVKTFINRIQKSYPTMQIEVEEHIESDCQFHSSQAFHLYRILQETINNALKHSGAMNIKVTFKAASSWSVTVADDGKGMDAVNNLQNGSGNGLINIRERVKEAGWTVHWQSGEGKGTIMEIAPTTN